MSVCVIEKGGRKGGAVVLWENGQFSALGCGITDVGACCLVVLVDGEVLGLLLD